MDCVKDAELRADLTYTYTPRSQIASINDQTVPNIDQAFTYDGIGRLAASTGPWGNGTFQYDGLGNIRQRAVGARTVGMSYNASNQLSAHTDTALAVPAPVMAGTTVNREAEETSVKLATSRKRTFATIVATGSLGPMTAVEGRPPRAIRNLQNCHWPGRAGICYGWAPRQTFTLSKGHRQKAGL